MPRIALAAALAAATLTFVLVDDHWFSRGGVELASQTRIAAPGLVRFEAPEGRQLLLESEAHEAFFPLIAQFETQKSTAHCGPASIVMVLNALEVPAPAAFDSYRAFTQDNVFDALSEPVTSDRAVARRGMTLIEVASMLRAYGLSVDVHYAGQSSADDFRREAAQHLGRSRSHVIVNYSRTALGRARTHLPARRLRCRQRSIPDPGRLPLQGARGLGPGGAAVCSDGRADRTRRAHPRLSPHPRAAEARLDPAILKNGRSGGI
jgi:hypothetical protein